MFNTKSIKADKNYFSRIIKDKLVELIENTSGASDVFIKKDKLL